jgi:peptidoglycan/LPS O-acetylase OafA/YrhL
LAIALVLISHIDRRWEPLGAVGVILFFVLSGFLITALMSEERERSGDMSLPQFYRRRALRLFPALAVYVLVVTPLALLLWPADANLSAALSTVFYVANWHQAAVAGNAGAFGQMWSLAIEEQFYLT